ATFLDFEYDLLGYVVREDSSHGVQVFERNKVGMLQRAWIDEGEVTLVEFERDALGRVVKERQGHHEIESSSDIEGRRTMRSMPGCGVTRYQYDATDTLTRLEHETPTGDTYQLDFQRDLVGREILRSDPGGRVTTRQHFDLMDRLVEQEVLGKRGQGTAAMDVLT